MGRAPGRRLTFGLSGYCLLREKKLPQPLSRHGHDGNWRDGSWRGSNGGENSGRGLELRKSVLSSRLVKSVPEALNPLKIPTV